MVEEALATTLQPEDVFPAAKANALAKALRALGLLLDNDGDPAYARSLGPIAVRSKDTNAEGKVVTEGGSFPVPAGKLFVVTWAQQDGAWTITPSGGSAFTVTSGVTGTPVYIPLGAGDATQVANAAGTTGGVLGYLLSAPADLTRILQVVDNVTSYQVPAGRQALLTTVLPAATAALTIDGAGISVSTSRGIVAPIYLKAGQTVAGDSATDLLICGFEADA